MTDPRNIAHDKKVQQEKKHRGEEIAQARKMPFNLAKNHPSNHVRTPLRPMAIHPGRMTSPQGKLRASMAGGIAGAYQVRQQRQDAASVVLHS